eukprot:scaffold321200_cov14-Tisochrysis_lutea.AAC.1
MEHYSCALTEANYLRAYGVHGGNTKGRRPRRAAFKNAGTKHGLGPQYTLCLEGKINFNLILAPKWMIVTRPSPCPFQARRI